MWLLNTKSYHLERFQDDDIPRYAILSHKWEKQEVTFRMLEELHMVSERDDEVEEDRLIRATELEEFPHLAELVAYRKRRLFSRKGWSKIEMLCERAGQDGYEYAWIDTCCIDKSSSAELQESINSMYNWYRNASICYVYMCDVWDKSPPVGSDRWKDENFRAQFRNSTWFKRGWTLQELLASSETLLFLDSDWNMLGYLSDSWSDVCEATKIPERAVCGPGKQMEIQACDVAAKMSWMAGRETTRKEDMAYCLLGVFGVNMPLLYGEGLENAFSRLQIEIMKISRDETIFLWNLRSSREEWNMFARTPLDFQRYNPSDIFRVDSGFPRGPCEMTNHGLRIAVLLFKHSEIELGLQNLRFPLDELHFAPLLCESSGQTAFVPLLQHVEGMMFLRIGPLVYAKLDWFHAYGTKELQTIYIAPGLVRGTMINEE